MDRKLNHLRWLSAALRHLLASLLACLFFFAWVVLGRVRARTWEWWFLIWGGILRARARALGNGNCCWTSEVRVRGKEWDLVVSDGEGNQGNHGSKQKR